MVPNPTVAFVTPAVPVESNRICTLDDAPRIAEGANAEDANAPNPDHLHQAPVNRWSLQTS